MNKISKDMYKGIYPISLDSLFKCKCKIEDMNTELATMAFLPKIKDTKKISSRVFKNIRIRQSRKRAIIRKEIAAFRKKCNDDLSKYTVDNQIYTLFNSDNIFTEVAYLKRTKDSREIVYTYGVNKTALVIKDKMCRHITNEGNVDEFTRLINITYVNDNEEKKIGNYKIVKGSLFNKAIYHTYGDDNVLKFLYSIFTKDVKGYKLNV